jgi:hypothetical protein
MNHRLRKGWPIVAGVLIVALVAQLTMYAWDGSEPEAAVAATEDDRRVAADVSNLTGAPVEDVLALKGTGQSWSEVLETLEQNNGSAANRGARDARLSDAGMSSDTKDELLSLGFTEDQMTEAKLLAERVRDQLNELANAPVESDVSPFEERKPSAYAGLAERFLVEESVRYMLLLEEKLGSYELALDEYVLALQLELDPEMMLEDESAYEEAKAQAMAGKRMDEIVRLQDIELAVLALIQRRASQEPDIAPKTADSMKEASLPDAEPGSPLPDVPTPTVVDVRPANPTQSILDEIESLNPNR